MQFFFGEDTGGGEKYICSREKKADLVDIDIKLQAFFRWRANILCGYRRWLCHRAVGSSSRGGVKKLEDECLADRVCVSLGFLYGYAWWLLLAVRDILYVVLMCNFLAWTQVSLLNGLFLWTSVCVWEARFQGEGVVAWWTVAGRSSRLSCS